jgi:enediyne biosynthesis protein E4
MKPTLLGSLIFAMAWLLQNAAPAPSPHASPASSMQFRELGKESGIATIPPTAPDKRYLMETMGGGVALFDCDNDGKLDILVVGDSTIDRFLHGGDPMVYLYHQDGDLHFTDVTKEAGLTTLGWGMGVAIGDFDNDGLPDIYVTGYGHNVLYHNLGGCKFEDVTERAHVSGGGFSVGAAWADYDRDGNLDLFVSRYVHSDIHHLPQPGSTSFSYKGLPIEVPGTEGETFLLYHNRGDGTFEEVSAKAGVDNAEKRRGMGVVWGDYDDDGWPDLFVANDMDANYLFHNRHDGTFEDVGMITGTAVDPSGLELGNMAGDFGDFDRDGKLDLVVSRFGNQPESLYRNQGEKGFVDVTWDARIGRSSSRPVKWGTGFADFDNDGWPDIFVANGNVSPRVDGLPNEAKYREPLLLYRNRGDRTFEEIADAAGLNNGSPQSRRGAVVGDLNNDGNLDLVVYNVGAPPSVFVNETRNSNHRVMLRLVGAKSNRAAIGAKVSLSTAAMKQIDEVRGGGSYLSSNDQRLHFGLGADATIDRIEIRWPSGAKEELRDVAGDYLYTIVEGKGIVDTIKLPSVDSLKSGKSGSR